MGAKHNRMSRPQYHELMQKKLVGRVVLAKYNQRIWQIDEVDFKKNVDSTFPQTRTGEDISFYNYFSTTYPEVKAALDKAGKKPGLLVNRPKKARTTKKETVLLPCLCHLTGMDDEMKKNVS